jgi:hypothetical protein
VALGTAAVHSLGRKKDAYLYKYIYKDANGARAGISIVSYIYNTKIEINWLGGRKERG